LAKDSVHSWLQKTGFPLEMKAAAAFRRAGFDVRQSFVYQDPEQSKGREIDVFATDPDSLGVIDISFIIECKASVNPWVILTSEDTFQNYNKMLSFCIASTDARAAMIKRMLHEKRTLPFLERPSRGGYALRQAFAKKEDDISAYTAAMGALKAAKEATKERVAESIPKLSFSFPVIVVDAPLFECTLLDNGELDLKEVEQSDFLFSAHIPEAVGCAIKIVSAKRLDAFAGEARTLADNLRNEFRSEEVNAL
jgi:hypothetical protein